MPKRLNRNGWFYKFLMLIPPVSQPSKMSGNQATHNAMTDVERRISTLVDIIVIIVVFLFLAGIAYLEFGN